MLSLLLLALLLWVCFGVGAAALSRLRARPETLAEKAPYALALGLGVLSYLMLAIGLLGGLRPWIVLVVLAGLAVLGWRHLLRLPAALLAGARQVRLRAASLPLLAFFLAVGGMTLLGALAPSGDNDYDGLFYHLTLPRLYLEHGRIFPMPWLTHSNFPFLMEMLYLLGLLLKGQVLAKLLHFAFGWITVLAVYAFARRAWGPRAGVLGAAALANVPLLAWEMTSAYNELAFACYAFLAVTALVRWYEGREPAWLWASALLCGFALGTKMLALAAVLFVVLVLLYALRGEAEKGRALRRLIAFGLVAAAVASPWYLKSYLWTGNPVYPFFYEVFGGRFWTPQRAAEYTTAQHAFGMGGGLLHFLALPWNLTMNPHWFFDLPGTMRPFSLQIAVFGPLFLAFLPALVALRPIGAAARLLLLSALLYLAAWFPMSQNLRYLLPLLPALSALVGMVAARLLESRNPVRLLVVVAFALPLVMGVSAAWQLAAPATAVVLGQVSEDEYLRATCSAYGLAEAVNAATPPNAKVIVLGDEPRMFYLDRDFLLGNHAQIFTEEELAHSDRFLVALRRMGVTEVLLHGAIQDDVRNRRGQLATDLAELMARQELTSVTASGAMSLWHVADATR